MPSKKTPTKLPDAFRAYLSALGAKGGKATAGKSAREWWGALSKDERSRIMKERAKKRKAGKKKR